MKAYIVDTFRNKIEQEYPNHCSAFFDMSDNYGNHPDNRYKILHDEEDAWDYWYDMVEGRGVLYEGLGISEDTKHDMFKQWLTNDYLHPQD